MRDLVAKMLVGTLSIALGWTTTHLGCSPSIQQIESYSDPNDDANLSNCRAEGRAVYQLSENKTHEDALRGRAAYDRCKCDAGYCK